MYFEMSDIQFTFVFSPDSTGFFYLIKLNYN